MDWSGEAEHQAIPRQLSPDRRAPEEYSRKSALDHESKNTRRWRDVGKSRREGPGNERDDRLLGWRDNRPQDRNADHPRNLRDDHHQEGSADNCTIGEIAKEERDYHW